MILGLATPKRDYYAQWARGNRLFELGLGPVTLALRGASSPEDQKLIDRVVAEAAPAGFADAFLRVKAPGWAAEALSSFSDQVPKQMSTGGRPVLGRVSKRGNRYLRVLFVQAARVVLLRPASWERHGLKRWIEAATKRLHPNKPAIALANKLARITWGVLHYGRDFEVRKEVANASQPT